MKILLSYSKTHFDPTRKQSQHKFWDSSANILARTLHEKLSQLGELTYIDAWDYKAVPPGDFDLFVGIYMNFEEILAYHNVKKSLFFAVNMHPAERNAIIADFIESQAITRSGPEADWHVDTGVIGHALTAADGILCVGNIAVYNSYIKNGIPKSKVFMLNYGVGDPVSQPAATKTGNKLLYVASEIGVRKGFDIVDRLARRMAKEGIDFKLSIVGTARNDHYKQKLAKLAKDLPKQVKSYGWVESHTRKYVQLLREQDYVLAPAIEEGQAGAVLDAMRQAVVPILTENSGIDYSPAGMLEMSVDSDSNYAVLIHALNQTPEELTTLKQQTLEYYTEFHQDALQPLGTIFQRFLDTDSLYPKVSVVLPIFNKETTIVALLRYLTGAMTEYPSTELHIIFDGCKDNSEGVVRNYFKRDRGYPVTFEVTPDIFEVKTNNIGLKKSTGDYSVIIQDDNYVYDKNIFYETVTFLEKNSKAVILGCLAGVNFYPRGHKGLVGLGQLIASDNETYWRQDADTDPSLQDAFFEVDACMRGPLIFRKSFIDEYGPLDEVYVPFYMDDMDIAYRARQKGKKVYAVLSDVENKSFTIATYNKKRIDFWNGVIKRNTDIFYSRWKPSIKKNYLRLHRTHVYQSGSNAREEFKAPLQQRLIGGLRSIYRMRRVFNTAYCRSLADSRWQARMAWIQAQAAVVPKGAKVLDIGAGQAPYRESFAHTNYITQDLAQTPDFKYGKIDIISDILSIPLPDNSVDVILCTEVFEHIPHPIEAMKEIGRLLKPGGRLIFSAPLMSGQHQKPYHYYGGYTRFWYQKFLPEAGLDLISLQPNGGLGAHSIEMLWRNEAVLPFSGGSWLRRLVQYPLHLFTYNIPTLLLDKVDQKGINEDFTACFFCIAQKSELAQKGK